MTDLNKLQQIFDKIEEYKRILLFRHFRPDGDCTGATKGFKEILQLTYPEKEIYLQNCDFSDYLKFLGEEDELLDDELYKDALAIVIDTGTLDRVSNPKCTLCKEIIKIDHHIDDKPYGDISWVEEERSSACEMIALYYQTFKDKLKINKYAATCIYTGMVTDSGRFRFRSVSGDTMRLAGMLVDMGIDLDHLYANLYLEDYNYIKFKANILGEIQMTENGVAYIYVSHEMREKFGLSQEDASTVISFMEGIKGSIIWLAFIENEDGSIRVRLRSRFVEVSPLANNYHGGGHACAAGATVYSEEEYKQLLSDADKLIKDYKENNEDWL